MLHNPFAELTLISPGAMQTFLVLAFLAVLIGTILDILHKQSAEYFFRNAKKAEDNARTPIDSATKRGLAIKTVTNEVLTSSEFCNTRRRISHLLTMYGFILFVISTVVLVFNLATPGEASAKVFALLWHIGALSLCIGGYWFWFSIRVDVASEGVKWYQFNGRGDLFILGLLFTATFGLLWSWTQMAGWSISSLMFALFMLAATVLFFSVYWSKFAHMFFKPAAAFQKKVAMADGSQENLPSEYDLTDPEVQAKFPDIPEYLGKNPPDMGLGIKREAPQHY